MKITIEKKKQNGRIIFNFGRANVIFEEKREKI